MKRMRNLQKGCESWYSLTDCHSGTVTKEAFYTGNFPSTGQEKVRYRYMPRLIAQRVYRKNKEFYDAILKKPGLTGSEEAGTGLCQAYIRVPGQSALKRW